MSTFFNYSLNQGRTDAAYSQRCAAKGGRIHYIVKYDPLINTIYYVSLQMLIFIFMRQKSLQIQKKLLGIRIPFWSKYLYDFGWGIFVRVLDIGCFVWLFFSITQNISYANKSRYSKSPFLLIGWEGSMWIKAPQVNGWMRFNCIFL